MSVLLLMSFFVPLVSFVMGWIDLDERSAPTRAREEEEDAELEPLLIDYNRYGGIH